MIGNSRARGCDVRALTNYLDAHGLQTHAEAASCIDAGQTESSMQRSLPRAQIYASELPSSTFSRYGPREAVLTRL